jgi:uncharacterized protein YjbI with pentapeptide repeats
MLPISGPGAGADEAAGVFATGRRGLGEGDHVDHAVFDGRSFARADLKEAVFTACSFVGADFGGARLAAAQFRDCNLTNVRLRGARLFATRFEDCKLLGQTSRTAGRSPRPSSRAAISTTAVSAGWISRAPRSTAARSWRRTSR